MTHTRRHFLGTVAATAAAGFFHSLQAQEQRPAGGFPSQIYKARIADVFPTDEICEAWKAAGFDGMEVTQWNPTIDAARKSRLIAEKHGLRIHSVMRGWTEFNQPDKYDADVESVKIALRAASAYGADAILLVPCRIGGMKMPEPWDFDIDFDPKTLKIKTVAKGDNAPYADYVAAHNAATEASIRAVESLIPVAAQEGVRICLENVWNNLWCTPKFFAAFCKYFDHPWVGCYFDLGNHIKYARCEEWIKELGNSIVKLHIKGFKVSEVKGKLGGGPGDWCRIDQASIDWKSVRKLLAENRYSGWMTIEEGSASDTEYSQMLDQIIAM
ncbi:MAG: sugar phosphate isomerase/epimerase [Planctomycetaceae bacterium]|jgi:hexulose-6-phosphate isomerase|nr:sugar phosphate isomerase/epimerase [Planctomycetaceae bacterium]